MDYSIERDGWRLLSAEERSTVSPSTFVLPPRSARESLAPGDGVQLLFDMETREGGRVIDRGVDRMWVIVKRRAGAKYVGVLDSDPGRDGVPIRPGRSLLFGPEHVVAIQRPPEGYVRAKYGTRFFESPDPFEHE